MQSIADFAKEYRLFHTMLQIFCDLQKQVPVKNWNFSNFFVATHCTTAISQQLVTSLNGLKTIAFQQQI